MKKMIILIVFTFCIFLTSTGFAQFAELDSITDPTQSSKTFRHALNICPIAPAFGIYAVNYEYLFTPKHGILARIEYEDVPKAYTDASIESNGWAYSLNYRRHLSEEMNSIFIGAYSRYRNYKGSGTLESKKFDFKLPSFTLGLNAGKRWVWNSGFNITFSLGYGFSMDDRQATPSDAAIETILDKFEKEYDFISPFYGELSIGYAF